MGVFMRRVKCDDCSTGFYGTAAAHRCKKCRAKRAKMLQAAWRKAHPDYYKNYRSGQNTKTGAYWQAVQANHKKIVRENYCAAYDPINPTCVECFEEGSAEFRGCFK